MTHLRWGPHRFGTGSISIRRAPVGACLVMAMFAAGTPAGAQEAEAGWEIRVVMDGSRHETRRIRGLFFRTPQGPLTAPTLGPRFLGFLHRKGIVGEWPGFDGATPPPAAGALVGLSEDSESGVSSRDRLEDLEFHRHELPLSPGAEWRRPGSDRPTWTVVLKPEGGTVLELVPPLPLPLVPERVDVKSQDVLWGLHHGSDGEVDWAVAIGFVGGSTSAYWEAFWRAPSTTGPRDLDDGMDQAPWPLMRHVLETYRVRDSWGPMATLKASLASVRYNLVEGGSLEVPVWFDLTSTIRLQAWTRMSTTSYPLNGGVGITLDHWPARWGVEAYRRLLDANRWEPAETKKGNSFSALLHGRDNGHYFTSRGASVWWERQHGTTTWRTELFAESDRPAPLLTDYSLLSKDSTDLPTGLNAEEGDYYGFRGVLEHQTGLKTGSGVLLTRLWFGTAGGDRAFSTLGGSFDALKSWNWWAAGVRIAGGRVFGDAPIQREFFLGGVTTVRGFDPASEQGPVIAFGRLELGFGPSVARLMVFSDAGWAGEWDELGHLAAAGWGISFAEGLFRLDFAKPVSGGTGLKVYFTGNGLL